MRAVQFSVSARGFVLARSLGRVSESALFGSLSGLSLADVSLPELPGPQWVRARVLLCGVCGSDVGNVTYASSPAMEPFGSFPAVLGHEILARVEEVGAGVTRVEPGQRVAVDPMLSCRVRGHESPCPSCAAGLHSTCEEAGEEGELRVGGRPLSPGLTMGYHRDLPGGWGEEILVHESQLFPVPDVLEDRVAVLVEPLSIGVHAALNSMPRETDEVLVIGSGPIALGTIWALRAVGFEGTLLAQTKRAHEAELAKALGADEVIRPGGEARDALIRTGARAYQPILGDEVFSGGGFPLVFDCVGSKATLEQAMRFASPRGTIVMLGCAAQIPKLDLTFVWARELDIKGYVGYGREEWRGRRVHTFQVTQELLAEGGAPVDRLVTHVFPLAQYREAISAAANHRRSGAVKVLVDPRS